MGLESRLQVIVAAGTNLTLLPAIFYAYRRKQSFIFIITLMSLITSIAYHTVDAWENPPPSTFEVLVFQNRFTVPPLVFDDPNTSGSC